MSSTAGSSSYSTRTRSPARRACSGVSAASTATGSPAYRTTPSAITGWSENSSPNVRLPGTSSIVSTAFTPGARRRLGRVDRQHLRVRERRPHRVAPQHVLGPQVARERELPLDLGHAVHARRRHADAVADPFGRPRSPSSSTAPVCPPSSESCRAPSAIRRATRWPSAASRSSSTPVSRPSATTRRPSTNRSRTRRGAQNASAATDVLRAGERQPGDVEQRHVGPLAGFQGTDLVIAAQAGRAAARRRAAAPRAPTAPSGPSPARATNIAWRTSARRSFESFDALPSTPSPTGAPASSRSRTRAIPEASRRFDDGQCAIAGPGRGEPSRCPWSDRCTPCASHTSGPRNSRSSSSWIGRTPNRSRQKSSSSSASAMCVCSRSPSRRASAADSFISSVVTLNGEQGATAMRSIDAGRRVVEPRHRVLGLLQDRVAVLHDRVGGQPAVATRRGPSNPGTGGTGPRPRRAASISAASRSPDPAGNT